MKTNLGSALESFRIAGPPGALFGLFQVGELRIMSSGIPDSADQPGWPWEHVSVSAPNRTPTWDEMSRVKDWFWESTETVVQFHPRKAAYVNIHPHCLHLWRRRDQEFELPPCELV